MNKFLNLLFKGILVGVANIIPGVSGGTIAVVLRIFDQMIDAINNFFKDPKKHIKFLVPLILGSIIGILIFSKIIEICLDKESFPTSMFFVGLVVGSIPLIYEQTNKKQIKPTYYLVSLISFLAVVLLSFAKSSETNSIGTTLTTFLIIKIFFFSMIASAAMVIPGISGSFVMVLLGIYNIILTSISGFISTVIESLNIISNNSIIHGIKYIINSDYFIILFTSCIGILIGIILISKIIAILLKKAFSITYFSILGLIFASIFLIFKDPMTYSSYLDNIPFISIILGIFLFFIGFFIAFKLGKE